MTGALVGAKTWDEHFGHGPGEQPTDFQRRLASFHQPRASPPPGTRLINGAIYRRSADGGALRIWIYAQSDTAILRPGLLLVHGGGWLSGTPFMLIRHAEDLAGAGFVAGVISYPLYPSAGIPEQVNAVANAYRWVRSRARLLGLDSSLLGLGGASAGGHLAVLANAYLGRRQGLRAERLILMYPMLDLDDCGAELAETVAEVAGTGDHRRALNPIELPDQDIRTPTASLVGSGDELTPPAMIQRYHRRLDVLGVANRVLTVSEATHAFDLEPDRFNCALGFLEQSMKWDING